MIRILVDSSSDYRPREITERGLDFVPINIVINGRNYADGIDLERNRFYELLVGSETLPTTSQPSPQAFLDLFLEVKQKGEEMICILLSSALSGTYQSAQLAREMADYEGIYLIDSLSATFPIKILAEYAQKRATQGADARRIASEIEALKARVKVVAALDTLNYLSKGGRISKTTAAIGEMANLKPVITITPEGTVGILGKCLGRNKAVSFLAKYLEEIRLDPAFPVYTLYSYGASNCARLEEKLAAEGYTVDARLQIGATIGTHIGPEAFGIVFVTEA